ncbi:MAG: hypothetical protein ACRCYY_13480, partial [Trueperaceae bacterium]
DKLGMSIESVAFWGGLLSLISLVGTFASGVILKYFRDASIGLFFAFACLGSSAVVVFGLGLPQAPTLISALLMLASAGLIQGFVFSSVPLVSIESQDVVRANAGISQMGNTGAFLGAPLFAWVASQFGWGGGGMYVLLCALMGCICALGLKGILAKPYVKI